MINLKIFEMGKLPWITQVDPNCTNKCAYKTEAEGDLTTEKKAV